jgi:hypothetical protein
MPRADGCLTQAACLPCKLREYDYALNGGIIQGARSPRAAFLSILNRFFGARGFVGSGVGDGTIDIG